MNQFELLILTIVHSLNVSKLLYLDFHIVSDMMKNMWINLIAEALQLKDIAISGRPTWGLLDALLMESSEGNIYLVDGVLFPMLQIITISDITFDDTLKDVMLEVVCKCQTRGFVIDCLDIRVSRHFQSRWIIDFEKYVSTVYQDGHDHSQLPIIDDGPGDISFSAEYSNLEEKNISLAYSSEYASIDKWDYQD